MSPGFQDRTKDKGGQCQSLKDLTNFRALSLIEDLRFEIRFQENWPSAVIVTPGIGYIRPQFLFHTAISIVSSPFNFTDALLYKSNLAMYFSAQGLPHAIDPNAMHASYLFSVKHWNMCPTFNKPVIIMPDGLVGMPLTHRDGMFASKDNEWRSGRWMGKGKKLTKKKKPRRAGTTKKGMWGQRRRERFMKGGHSNCQLLLL